MTLLYKSSSIKIPDGCSVSIHDKQITINGTKYKRVLDLSHLNLTFTMDDNSIIVNLWNSCSKEQNKINTCASIIRNAINGCMYGYRYVIKAACKHFPMSINIEEGGKLIAVKNFLGEKMIRKFKIDANDVNVTHGETKDILVFEGKSIEQVSQCVGTLIEGCRAKKRDNRVLLDGFYIMKKGLIMEE